MAEPVVQYQDDGTTWSPDTTHGKLSANDLAMLDNNVFAFPESRLLPLTDADHVQAAMAQIREITGVSERERALAFANIRKAAQHYEIDLSSGEWQEFADFSE